MCRIYMYVSLWCHIIIDAASSLVYVVKLLDLCWNIFIGLTMDVGQRTNLRSYMYIIEHLSNNTRNAIRREVEGEEERLDHLSPALQTSLRFTPTVSKV